jgi:hypothetical protein
MTDHSLDYTLEALDCAAFAAEHGLRTNQYDHVYHPGKSLEYDQKVTIALDIVDAKGEVQMLG